MQGLGLVPVLWQILVKKYQPKPRTSGGSTVTVIEVISAFVQLLVDESYILPRQIPTPTCLHFLNTIHFCGYQN